MTPQRSEHERGAWGRLKFWVGLGLGVVLGAAAMNWYWVETTCQVGELCL